MVGQIEPTANVSEGDILRITLFGAFTVRVGTQAPLVFATRKEQELLAYLVMHADRAHARESLANLLWDNVTTSQSRKYLRRALWRLRSSLAQGGVADPSRLISGEGDSLRFAPGPSTWVDALVFETALDRAGTADVPGAETALRLYRGELLDGWFEDWCLYERERLRLRYVEAVQALADGAERRGDYVAAAGHAVDWVYHDGLNERAHAFLMRVRYLAGDRAGAAHQYAVCEAMLKEEMGVAPSPSTRALIERIRAGEPLAVTGDGAASRPPRLGGFVEVLHRIEDELLRLHEEVRAEVLRLEREGRSG